MSERPTDSPSGNGPSASPHGRLFDAFPPVSDEVWRAQIETDLGSADYDDEMVWHTLDDLAIDAYYRRSDLERIEHLGGATQASPLAHATRSPANAWRICESITHPDPDTAHAHLRAALDDGATDISLHFGPHVFPHAGIRLTTQETMSQLLDGVALNEASLHLRGGIASLAGWSGLLNEASKRGASLSALRGSIDYDPVAALAAHRATDPTQAFDYTAQAVSYGAEHTPSFKTLTVSAVPYHEAGASTVHELGATLASLSEQYAQASERGVDVASMTEALHIIIPVGTSYFKEIAKLRALRLLVPQVVQAYMDEPEADRVQPSDVFVQAVASRRDLTVYGPHVNMLRGTTSGAAAVIGGCDVLVVHPYDIVFEPPSGFAQRIARNTQLVLQHEAHLDHVADPAAGSYYIETMTDKLARAAWSYFQYLEAEGGITEALRSGALQETLAGDRARRQQEVAERGRVLVGTNHYPDPEDTKRDALTPAESARPAPDASGTPVSLNSDDLIGSIRAAWADGAAVDGIMDALTPGDDRLPAWDALPFFRPAEAFEAVRLRTEAYAATHGTPPVVFLLPVGHRALRSARATFARNVFGCAGFKLVESLHFDSVEDGAEAALNAEADVVVLCSSDPEYADFAPALCQHLDRADSDALVVVAGYPEDDLDALRDAGVDRFIHRHTPLLDELRYYQDRLGMNDADPSPATT